MKIKRGGVYNIDIYIGSCEGYKGKEITEQELIDFIGAHQRNRNVKGLPASTVTLTRIKYIYEDYVEDGWKIGMINYLRFPKTYNDLDDYMLDLGKALLEVFKQNRISIVSTVGTILLESENAEQSHK